jgi:3-carboxy-cis,cis-muconate cycloisomerase
MSDERSTAARVPDPGIRALFRRDSRWQAWLDVEAALARAQAELGIIPDSAAQAIAQAARLELLDRDRIDEAARRTSHTIVPLVWELSRVAGDAGGWVHWGATTQNITQTGDLIVLRHAHRIFLRLIGRSLEAMAGLAERGADMLMPGRTHGQHALPLTFGYKAAVWIDEMLRHVERLQQAEPRVFVAMFGGGAGTFASVGAEGNNPGPEIQARMAAHLGMRPMTVPARTVLDHLAEYVALLGLLGATCGKIGREIYTLMKTEFGEVEEPVPPGTVGSSTMPQKRNPKLCQDIIAFAAEVRSTVPLAFEAMQAEHEADRTTEVLNHSADMRAAIATGDMLSRLVEVFRGLELHPRRMRANLDLSGGLIMAEAVMLDLGKTIGRQHAHDVVYDAAQAAVVEGKPFADLLAADPRVGAHLGRAEIATLLDPTAYTGLCAKMARDGAQRARRLAQELAVR